MIRNVVPDAQQRRGNHDSDADRSMRFLSADQFVANPRHNELTVRVASMPYAQKFGVANEEMSLRDFYDVFIVANKTHPADDLQAAPRHEHKPYVFQWAPEACSEGFGAIADFLAEALPMRGPQSLLCDPKVNGLGLNTMHFYIGNAGSGAPSHVHSDAVNLALNGAKRWKIVPPADAHFSKESVTSSGNPHVLVEPMECVQRAGDMIYVPFDWGHEVFNEGQVFGYTMELVNRRDTLMSVAGRSCGGNENPAAFGQ